MKVTYFQESQKRPFLKSDIQAEIFEKGIQGKELGSENSSTHKEIAEEFIKVLQEALGNNGYIDQKHDLMSIVDSGLIFQQKGLANSLERSDILSEKSKELDEKAELKNESDLEARGTNTSYATSMDQDEDTKQVTETEQKNTTNLSQHKKNTLSDELQSSIQKSEYKEIAHEGKVDIDVQDSLMQYDTNLKQYAYTETSAASYDNAPMDFRTDKGQIAAVDHKDHQLMNEAALSAEQHHSDNSDIQEDSHLADEKLGSKEIVMSSKKSEVQSVSLIGGVSVTQPYPQGISNGSEKGGDGIGKISSLQASSESQSNKNVNSRLPGLVGQGVSGSSQSVQTIEKNQKVSRVNVSHLIEKVEAAVKEAMKLKDGKSISFKMDPPHLGAVKVDLAYRESGFFARITADSNEVMNLLRDKAYELHGILRDLGLDASKVTVQIGDEKEYSNEYTFQNFDPSFEKQQQERSSHFEKDPSFTGLLLNSPRSEDGKEKEMLQQYQTHKITGNWIA
jgi:flagellar hook-length control protein FliK